ncbi:hypothetical protein P9112_001631 [Eukaryota sp. TZLM1-RC]
MSCRFTPALSSMDVSLSHSMLLPPQNVDSKTLDSKVLCYRSSAPAPPSGSINHNRVIYSQSRVSNHVARKSVRKVPSEPERTLDAPGLLNDFYVNTMDYSNSNVLAVALANSVYLWNGSTGSVAELCTLSEGDAVTSLKWTSSGTHLAIGVDSSTVKLWDVEKQKQVRTLRGHAARVSALSWNNHVLSSGSRDCSILNHDVRVAQHVTATLKYHQGEVCGLAWSHDGSQLASGANDNHLCVWNHESSNPQHILTDHQAAVRALAWSPFQRNLLASGGGTADRSIKTWNTTDGTLLDSVDTDSQVCALLWSKNSRELVSGHGYRNYEINVWRYGSSLSKVGEITGHTARVLNLGLSPDGETVVSASADESIRFWRVFEQKQKSIGTDVSHSQRGALRGLNIR